MELRKISLHLGLQRPLRLLHLSDNHICYADERDNERKRALAASRTRTFKDESRRILNYLDEALAYGKANCDLLIHTGDLIDFVSARNLEIMKEKLSAMDCFFAAGNHEYSQYVGEAWEDEAYKMQSYDSVQAAAPNDLRFASREIAGLNLVAVDNVYYNFTERQLQLLKAEAAKGMPILLLMHTPLHCDELYVDMMRNRQEPSASLAGTPEALMAPYPEYRKRQQRPDKPTLEFIDYLRSEPLVKAIAAGHLHRNYHFLLYGRLPMVVAGGAYDGMATEWLLD